VGEEFGNKSLGNNSSSAQHVLQMGLEDQQAMRVAGWMGTLQHQEHHRHLLQPAAGLQTTALAVAGCNMTPVACIISIRFLCLCAHVLSAAGCWSALEQLY
jgi:hypothetical protein